jgi:hypothetical protein
MLAFTWGGCMAFYRALDPGAFSAFEGSRLYCLARAYKIVHIIADTQSD